MPLPNPSVAPQRLPVLAAEALDCRRGERLLFRGLDLAVEPGTIVWLRGANGQGKTSLLRLLAGLSTPAGGRITWGGQPLREAGAAYTGQLLYLAHANALKDDLSALENLQFLARLQGLPDDAQACAAALGCFGLASRQRAAVRTLSQGQRRRVALARLALAGKGRLWILDEPYDALDTEGCAALDALLAGHARGGGAVLLTSHLDLRIDDPAPITLHLDAAARP